MNVLDQIERDQSRESRGQRGFSMVEMLIVVTLIMLMAAFALPNIRGYLQLAKVKGGARAVADEMQRARTLALKKNVNNGMVFYIVDNKTFGYYAEDTHDLETGQRNLLKANYAGAVAAEAAGPVRRLPDPVQFVENGAGRLPASIVSGARAIPTPPRARSRRAPSPPPWTAARGRLLLRGGRQPNRVLTLEDTVTGVDRSPSISSHRRTGASWPAIDGHRSNMKDPRIGPSPGARPASPWSEPWSPSSCWCSASSGSRTSHRRDLDHTAANHKTAATAVGSEVDRSAARHPVRRATVGPRAGR